MTTFTDRFSNIQPRVLRLANGDYLAVSEVGAPVTLGVPGNTADLARGAFTATLQKWSVWFDEPSEGR